MTEKHLTVLRLLSEGSSAAQIGEEMKISRRTVEGIIEKMKDRYKARNTVNLIFKYALDNAEEINNTFF